MRSILFVSKPVAPPWNDSGKNLVRELARGLTRYRATLMARDAGDPGVPAARVARVYPPSAGGFSPALRDQLRVFAHLLGARGYAAWHFFFAPNPRSCLAGRAATGARRVRSVHTLSSAPREPRALVDKLFADINVVLSQHTERRLLDAGFPAARLARIAPAVEPLVPLTDAQRSAARARFNLGSDEPVVVYPGDLEFGEGAALMLEAFRAPALSGASLVLACRAKTPHARAAELQLRERARALGLAQRVHFVGETPEIHALLGCAELVALPSRDLYAKMDYPLVLLEAMSLARPVVVAADSAAAELTLDQGASAVALRADALAAHLASLLEDAALRRASGARARAAVLAHYSTEHMARAYERVYDALLR
jgi:glycosyltransferase involved in cell wall biosynthesis